MKKNKNNTKDLEQIELSQKEKIIEWGVNILAFTMLLAFFLKIIFF